MRWFELLSSVISETGASVLEKLPENYKNE